MRLSTAMRNVFSNVFMEDCELPVPELYFVYMIGNNQETVLINRYPINLESATRLKRKTGANGIMRVCNDE